MPDRARVLVVGGNGFYGRYLVRDLLQYTEAQVTVASRNPANPEWNTSGRVRLVKCDMTDAKTLNELAGNAGVIVHCAGPFQDLPLQPLQAAIQARIDYVDISEDRAFHRRVRQLAKPIEDAGITVLSGMSVAPAMEILFARLMKDSFDRLLSVRTFAAPDTRKHRGRAMFHTMLLGVGRSFLQPRNGELREVWGWTEPEWVEFPPPLGKRLTYLVLEMADLDLLPDLLDVETVEFKAGTEWPLLNRLLGFSAAIRKRIGFPDWENFTPLVRSLSWLVGRFGRDEGGAVFECQGLSGGLLVTRRMAIIARRDGGIIPAILAAISTSKLISGDLQHRGLIPLDAWISSEELLQEFARRDLEIWSKPTDGDAWQKLSF